MSELIEVDEDSDCWRHFDKDFALLVTGDLAMCRVQSRASSDRTYPLQGPHCQHRLLLAYPTNIGAMIPRKVRLIIARTVPR